MRLFASALAGWVNPADAFAQLHLHEPNVFWLDREHHPTQRFSVVGGAAQTFWLDSESAYPWMRSQLEASVEIEPADQNARELPFDWRPGLVGLLEFEGSAAFMQVDRAMVFDHATRQMLFIGFFQDREAFDHWHHAALLRLALVGGTLAAHQHRHLSAKTEPAPARLRHAPKAYLDLIAKAQEHIAAGDVYQLCLTNELRVETQADAFATFNNLREASPAPYAAFLRLARPDGSVIEIVSSSPEQFLGISAAGLVTTKPIKGTRPRARNELGQIEPERDLEVAEELRGNTKERAENLMIVDLMRNDLARVCDPDSIAVPILFDVESYATVHQLVSTIRGQLTEGKSAVDALEAAFPGGSMTGAPKARAVEIIQDLELGNRGIYSGIIGWQGIDGAADWGMTIRTMVFHDGSVTIGVGGGITSDSDPVAELEETRIKAKALLRALGASDPWLNQ